MVIATALGLADLPSIALSVGLAFVFGYALTLRPLVAAGLSFRQAVHVALAADTVSVTVMEIADNAFLLAVPGALAAGLSDGLFWGSLAASLVVAFVVTVPINRAMILRGRGHAVVHAHYAH